MSAGVGSGDGVGKSHGGRLVLVPEARFGRWVEGFENRHGSATLCVEQGGLTGLAPDGSHFTATLPFVTGYDGPAEVDSFVAAAGEPSRWGMLLVRKGGFALATVREGRLYASKVGRRHVQGRTKAGGQSQQRFARRRANQADQVYRATAEHARRVWADLPTDALLVTAGDAQGVREVLALCPDAGRGEVITLPVDLPEPRQRVLEEALGQARSIRVRVTNAPGE